MKDLQIRVARRNLTGALAAIALVLVMLSVAGQLYFHLTPRESPWGIVGLFNVDFEMNVPTFYAVLVLLLGAALLAIIALLKRNTRAPYSFHWALMSLGFFVIAADEFMALHEKLSEPLRRLLAWEQMGHLHYAWVIPGIALAIALAVAYTPFLARLDRATRGRLVIAAVLYLGGALGVELIGGRYAEAHGTWNLTYSLITTVEEGLELAGSIMLVDTLLRYIGQEYGAIRLVFNKATARS